MPLHRVRTVHTGLAGSPFLTTMYFEQIESVSTGTIFNNVVEFWQACAPRMSNLNVANVQGEIQTISEVDGSLLEVWNGTSQGVPGSATGSVQPYATQTLLRLSTGRVAGGRLIKGRIFIPAVPSTAGDPVPDPAYKTVINNAAAALITSSSTEGPWKVWSKTNGASYAISNASCWDQYAVLRSRRP